MNSPGYKVTPLIRQIAEGILESKLEDSLPGVQMLPSEQDLAHQLGVSRGSIRSAIQYLTTLGQVTKLPNGRTCFGTAAPPTESAETPIIVFSGRDMSSIDSKLVRDGLLACASTRVRPIELAPIEALSTVLGKYCTVRSATPADPQPVAAKAILYGATTVECTKFLETCHELDCESILVDYSPVYPVPATTTGLHEASAARTIASSVLAAGLTQLVYVESFPQKIWWANRGIYLESACNQIGIGFAIRSLHLGRLESELIPEQIEGLDVNPELAAWVFESEFLARQVLRDISFNLTHLVHYGNRTSEDWGNFSVSYLKKDYFEMGYAAMNHALTDSGHKVLLVPGILHVSSK